MAKLSKKEEKKIRKGICPVCGCTNKWLRGPKGGLAVMFKCDNCKSEFTIYPKGFGVDRIIR